MVSYHSILSAFLIAFTLFGIIELVGSDEIQDQVKAQIYNQSQEHPVAAFVFAKTLNDLTPTVSYPLPFTESKIYNINEFPFLGWTHAIGIIILIFIASLLFYKLPKGYLILILLLCIPIGYWLMNFILLAEYNSSAEILGVTSEQARQIRQQFSNSMDTILLPVIVLMGYSIALILKHVVKRAKK
jgi:hypothetical protein